LEVQRSTTRNSEWSYIVKVTFIAISEMLVSVQPCEVANAAASVSFPNRKSIYGIAAMNVSLKTGT